LGGLQKRLVVTGALGREHGGQDARERPEVVAQQGVAGIDSGGDLTERHLRRGKGLAEGVEKPYQESVARTTAALRG